MIALIVTVGLLFIAAAVALLVRAVALPRARMTAQMRRIRSYGFDADLVAAPHQVQPSSFTAELESLAEGFGRFTHAAAPALTRLSSGQLIGAGVTRISADAFHGYRAMFAVVVATLLAAESVLAHRSAVITVLFIMLGGAAAWVLPAGTVRRRAQARQDRIDVALPELIDVLTATIEAGLGFGGSLQLVADRFEGPLGDELRLTLNEQNMGLSTERALANMLERCESSSMRAFVRAVLQGQALGVSVGQTMRSVATETRQRRRQAAHEKVQKAPVKLLFPLVGMIFPALLLVILYPAVHQLLLQLGG
jgi:tight adherence protein C